MTEQTDYGRRVGTTNRLPKEDVFGGLRRPGYATRGVGDGQIVCYPPGTPRARVDEAIVPIRAWLDEQATAEAAPKSKRKTAPPAAEQATADAGEEADADADA